MDKPQFRASVRKLLAILGLAAAGFALRGFGGCAEGMSSNPYTSSEYKSGRASTGAVLWLVAIAFCGAGWGVYQSERKRVGGEVEAEEQRLADAERKERDAEDRDHERALELARAKAKATKTKPEPVREHTVERQVVVARCKFCAELTPVDHEKCKHCGAPKFC